MWKWIWFRNHVGDRLLQLGSPQCVHIQKESITTGGGPFPEIRGECKYHGESDSFFCLILLQVWCFCILFLRTCFCSRTIKIELVLATLYQQLNRYIYIYIYMHVNLYIYIFLCLYIYIYTYVNLLVYNCLSLFFRYNKPFVFNSYSTCKTRSLNDLCVTQLRCTLLIALCVARGGSFLLEQPKSSLMGEFFRFQWLCRTIKVAQLNMHYIYKDGFMQKITSSHIVRGDNLTL